MYLTVKLLNDSKMSSRVRGFSDSVKMGARIGTSTMACEPPDSEQEMASIMEVLVSRSTAMGASSSTEPHSG